ncbi:MAG: AraC family ligand binding domain-containing protein, partial [Pseudomonadota bacterium]|nr:AraC family ligand binding domain-containing protein [Pseudomonadota bacterium]
MPRPVAVLADEYESGSIQARRSHKRAQVLYSISGVAAVTTDHASYILPPQRALWIPSGVAHEMTCRGPVSLRTLYIEERVRGDLPEACRVFEVSDLLRELILAAARMPSEYDEAGRDGRVMRLILDEIVSAPSIPLDIS